MVVISVASGATLGVYMVSNDVYWEDLAVFLKCLPCDAVILSVYGLLWIPLGLVIGAVSGMLARPVILLLVYYIETPLNTEYFSFFPDVFTPQSQTSSYGATNNRRASQRASEERWYEPVALREWVTLCAVLGLLAGTSYGFPLLAAPSL
ncbi:hypothetical protein DFQ30_009690 [Apophysomyces sp. BC1015]|nr:hypothetical protein DFQ30_009690 [Apophysomyces sp. BC1015]